MQVMHWWLKTCLMPVWKHLLLPLLPLSWQTQPVEHPVTAEDPLALQDGALDAVLARNRGSQWAPAKQGGGPPKAKGQKGGGKAGGGRSAGAKRKAAQGGKPAVKSLKVGARHVPCLSSPMFPPAEGDEILVAAPGVRQR